MTQIKNAMEMHRLDVMRQRVRAKGAIQVAPIEAELIRQKNYENHVRTIEEANWMQVQAMCDIRDIVREFAQQNFGRNT